MKKKIVSLLLIACLLCTGIMLTSCQKPSDVIEDAIENTQKLDSYAAEMEIAMEMDMGGMQLSIPVTMDMKVQNAQSDTPIMSATISMSMLGTAMDMDMYSDSEWVYILMDGTGYKVNLEDAGDEYDYAGDVDSMVQELPENLMAGKELVENTDGSQTMTIEIPPETFAEVFDELVANINEAAAGGELADITISDATVAITVADGYMASQDVRFKMEMSVSGMAMAANAKATLTFKNPGEAVTVTPMEGYQDFPEMGM